MLQTRIHPQGAFGALYQPGAGYEGRRNAQGRLYLQPVKTVQAPPKPTKAQAFRVTDGGAVLQGSN